MIQQEEIVQGDLLYHAVHGLCRVSEIVKRNQSGKETLCYSLVPKVGNKMKVRFIIAVAGMEDSGFHGLISVKQANEILDYLKSGDSAAIPSGVEPKEPFSAVPENQTWDLAHMIWSFSHNHLEVKDQKKRQQLERSVKGLVGELAFVFKMTLKEAAARIQKSLGNVSKINPAVLLALAHAGED